MRPVYTFLPNTLYLGDCLEVMQAFEAGGCAGSVDLIYLDPPFNSNADYSVLFKRDNVGQDLDEQAQFVAFKDTWYWTTAAAQRMVTLKNIQQVQDLIIGLETMIPNTPMLSYLSYMTERLVVMRRLLKETGSLYLHCNQTASHYLKLVLDVIFGEKNFITEIIWNYGTPSGGRAGGKKPVKVHDTLLVYAADYGKHYYERQHTPYSEKYVADWFRHTDTDGRQYRTRTRGGEVVKQYLDESKGVPLSTVWTDIMQLYGQKGWFPRKHDEALGYPTQKPRALLERIITASSKHGDIVLDPFAGCGTTAEASFRLKRKFLGIDISNYAIRQVCSIRLQDAPGISVQGVPTDFVSAVQFSKDPFKFEVWAVTCVAGMIPNDKQTGDGGIDGRGTLLMKPVTDGKKEDGKVIAQVKVGKPSADSIKAFTGMIIGGKYSAGLFITLHKHNPTPTIKQAIKDAGTYISPGGSRQHNRLTFWSIEEYFEGIEPRLPELAHPFTGQEMPKQIPHTETNGSVL